MLRSHAFVQSPAPGWLEVPRHRTEASAILSAPAGYVYALLADGKRASAAWISEPEPGRVLLERDAESGRLTTFTVDELPTGGSRVTIASDVTVQRGFRGLMERRMGAWVLRRACHRELARLADAVAHPAGADGWSLVVRRRPMLRPVRSGTLHPMQSA